jgi:hypothetical protein
LLEPHGHACLDRIVHHAAQKPGRKWAMRVELVDALVCAEKGSLDHVLRERHVAGDEIRRPDCLDLV